MQRTGSAQAQTIYTTTEVLGYYHHLRYFCSLEIEVRATLDLALSVQHSLLECSAPPAQTMDKKFDI